MRTAAGVLFNEVMASVHSLLGNQERAVEYLLASGAENRETLRLHQFPAIMRLRHISAVAEFLERRQDDPTTGPRR